MDGVTFLHTELCNGALGQHEGMVAGNEDVPGVSRERP